MMDLNTIATTLRRYPIVCAICHRALGPNEMCECFAIKPETPSDWAKVYAKMDK